MKLSFEKVRKLLGPKLGKWFALRNLSELTKEEIDNYGSILLAEYGWTHEEYKAEAHARNAEKERAEVEKRPIRSGSMTELIHELGEAFSNNKEK